MALDFADRELPGGLILRVRREQDAGALAAAYQRNRGHLAPWDPTRTEDFFTEAGQLAQTRELLALREMDAALPLVIAEGDQIAGGFTLSQLVRGAFQSANVGYWLDRDHVGRGLASAALSTLVDAARDDYGLHRLQAATLLANHASQSVLTRAGFERIGVAPNYLNIAGRWQDHVLFQRILHD
ncbi:GNAT family N-acetyltransferase [Leifsonia sp. 21MFCrub1.1]|uniref:GNAT family N-acetyltransferase n=1 Tax=Leifsonia sp. 21MFCrub1.1 TaxID=1798223 RepID=UPI00089282FA|nr:GNAT family N-acetyltransferase [Leifsonia sp. 21MFCrub1.1]SEB00121.1 [SSU ribosomal protein S5P]-alanine acetyltransferase [Leifsonia sp. 21MFCrub1.1]